MAPVEGERFSINYIARGEPVSDSARMRTRIATLFINGGPTSHVTRQYVELKLGVSVPLITSGTPSWKKFLQSCELRDFLDFITIVAARLLSQGAYTAEVWLDGVAEIFREENVRYRLDRAGGVHFAIDGEYERNQASTIGALRSARYSAVRHHIELGQRALDHTPPQTREAIRHTYEAVETLFKLAYPQESRLGPGEIMKRLKAEIEKIEAGTERVVQLKLAEAFKEWVVSAQSYRHGQAVEEPDNPSISTTVLSVSTGLAFARWLAEIDAARPSP